MRELKLMVPTYNYSLFPAEVEAGRKPEFGEPIVPVVIRESLGVRIVLGTHDFDSLKFPDIQIERQPNGWMIFLHPLAGSDASGYVYFRDDGGSFVKPENGLGPTELIEMVERRDVDVPRLGNGDT